LINFQLNLAGKKFQKPMTVALVVAHPDDEALWAGGTILMHPFWNWFILTLCRGNDPDRAPKFHRVLGIFRAKGEMGDLDDGPEQLPLDENRVKATVLELLPDKHFDMLITHDPAGEYTRHLRHEETSKAIIHLWYEKKISVNEIRTFAYEDGQRAYFPQPVKNADIFLELPEEIWQKKYRIITETYGFKVNSFEAQTTPRAEAFWQFRKPEQAWQWYMKGGNKL
jgi:LmbE family N-acetylglucosaminyl deacetylase